MHAILRRVSFAFALVLFAAVMQGQVASGTYPYGTYDDLGFDSINVGNLNVLFSIPVLNKTGRGIPFSYALAYNSSVWYPVSLNGVTSWQPVNGWGWQGLNSAGFVYIGYSETFTSGTCGQYGQYSWQSWTYNNLVYSDQNGTVHPFPGASGAYVSSTGAPPYCPPTGANPLGALTSVTTDGSGLSAEYYTNQSGFFATVSTSNGTSINAPFIANFSNPAGNYSVTDPNGNEITATNGSYTDTTGSVALGVVGNPPSNTLLSYTDTNGHHQSVTVTYSSYTVQTAFGCGIGEYGPKSVSLVSSITFPDGSAYTFTYEPTPGASGNVTGRLAEIQLPQGNTIKYGYTGGNNGIECADGSAAGLTRTLNSDSGSAASTWTYARTPGSGTSQTAVVDGLGNHKTYSFVLPTNPPSGVTAVYYETQRNIYEGAATGTPVVVRQTCYNAESSPCATTKITIPVNQIDTYESLNGSGLHGSTAKFNSNGMETEADVYDFGGSTSRGALLRREDWTYGYSVAGLPTEDAVYDGSSNLAGETLYVYDGSTPTTSSGVPQHVVVSGPRGNLTSVTAYANASTSYAASLTYEDTGTLLTSTSNSQTTTLSYDPTFVYNTSANLPTPSSGVALGASESFDTTYTGLPLTSTDPNTQVTRITSYDSMLRPTEIQYPDGGESTASYTPTTVTANSYQTSNVYGTTETQLDGYGRPSRVVVANGQSGNPWYQTDTCYDANGNTSFSSYAYQGTGLNASKVCSGSGDSYVYDVLGRVTSLTRANGEMRSYSYVGRATQSVDENGATRISQIDGLGRPTIVCEISMNNKMPGGSGSPTSCGTDIAGNGFTTTYSYALATPTTTITQGAQTRTFQTDWLGRTTSVTEPESGTTTYSYAYNSTGLTVTRKRPQANQTNPATLTTTTTQYDSLGRLVSIQYTDGTPNKTFTYDISNPWGTSVQNPKGRMVYAGISNAQSIYSYDPMGRVEWSGQCAPSNCGSSDYSTSYTYDWLGNVLTSADGSGATDTYTYSLANEVLSITSSVNDSKHPPNLLSNVQNGVFGPLSWNLGNGLTGVRQYDGLGRTSGGWVCSNSSQPSCSGGSQVYGFTSNWKGAELKGASDSSLNQTNTYGYDEFGRLNSLTVNSGTAGSYAYVYDRWGNRWYQNETSGSGGPQPQLSFNTSTNQITQGTCNPPTASQYCYDAAGNMTADGFHTYTFDAEGNVTAVDGGSAAKNTYDALNRRVRVDQVAGSVEYIFNPAGQHTSSWDPINHWEANGWAFWGSATVAFYGNGQTQFEHQDWLGTERARTTYNGQLAGTYSSLPFGDGYSYTGNDWLYYHFATLDHDSSSNTEHTQFRQYSSTQGRWMRPDPYIGSYDFTNPQSFNRYAYVGNNPLAYTDHFGLWCDNVCNPSNDPGDFGGGDSGTNEFDAMNIPIIGSDSATTIEQWQVTSAGYAWMLVFNPNWSGITDFNMPDPNDVYGTWIPYQWWPTVGLFGSDLGSSVSTSGSLIATNSDTPWYKSCTAKALGGGALSIGIDALGFIPGEKDVQAAVEIGSGTIARQIGNWNGYRGIVADQFGARFIAGQSQNVMYAGAGYSIGNGAGTGDWLGAGLAVGGLIPGLNEVAAVASIGYDAYKTVKAVASCP